MSEPEDFKGETITYWQVSPGKKEREFWPAFKRSNIIGMGWDRLGDLKQYSTERDIENALRQHYPADYPNEKYPSNHISSIKIFSQSIKEGDVIVAKKGASREVYGIGKVLRKYHFVDERVEFKHVINVDWIIGFDDRVEVETAKEFVQWTAHSLPQSRFDEVRQSILNRFPDLEGRFNQLMEGPTQVVSQPRNWWIEQTRVRGRPDREEGEYSLGNALWSPQRDLGGKDIYKNMRIIKEGNIILHLNLSDSNIIGVSVAAREYDSSFTCLRGTPWDDGTGKRPGYLIRLKDYQLLDSPIRKEDLLNEENRAKLFSILGNHKNLFYNRNLDFNQGTYVTSLPLELITLINDVYRAKTGKDLPYFDESLRSRDIQHLVYKIAWHPGGYKGGFCGDAQSTACEAFDYVKKHKHEKPCSPTVSHCVDEHEAFADSGWRVKIHPPRIKKLHELSEGKSLVFLVAPLTKSRTRYRMVGFYTINQKVIGNGNVTELYPDRNQSSKFDLEESKLEYTNTDLKNLFEIENWTPRRTYDFISSKNALSVLTKIYEIHEKKEIADPDVNTAAMKNAMESLRSGAHIEVLNLQPSFVKTKLMIDKDVMSQICANLNSGSHIIITGPVGTGKTSLGEDFCRAAKENKFCDGYVLTTASSDWTTFDTIGGYMPTEEGKLKFEQGKFLEAIRENKWLIIDEINRADIDKACMHAFSTILLF